MHIPLEVLIIILLILIIGIFFNISGFNNCNDSGEFSTPGGDISYRSYPSGNLPINYPELNEYEKNEYLRKFVNNS